jgi:hypothetical protein
MDKPQSATFTVSAETPHELARLLRRIADALDEGGSYAVPSETSTWSPGDPDALEPGPWTEHWLLAPSTLSWYRHRGLDLLDRLTPEAAQAVSYIARHAPRVPVADLGRELDKTPGPQLAGALSSIGYAWKALGAPEAPFRRVRSNYEMDPRLAEEIRRHLAASASDRGGAAESEGETRRQGS